MDVSSFLTAVKGATWYKGQLARVEELPPREAQSGEPRQALPRPLQQVLASRNMLPLYAHQAQALDALDHGEHVIVCTGAASGKSLCYHIPVLSALQEDRTARAVYLYPTKALAQDQLRSLSSLAPPEMALRVDTFDGDTPRNQRAQIRRSTQVVLTNPDMLHMGILPNHRAWSRLLHNLRFVVLDEVHVYRGVFGSHVANVVRRLRRLCSRYGSAPQFILCSATIANPGQLAQGLTGLPFTVVDGDGAPFGGKSFVFWNPPVIDEATGARRSANTEASQITVELLRRRVRTLTFVRTRRLAELVYIYVRNQLQEVAPELAGQVRPYRGTYLPEDRRDIEQALFQGRLQGVMATNALELGIDIGDLDATVLLGYPGSVASTWQQAGRSGRRGKGSLSILVGQDNPLDQYIMRHPDFFFGRPHEQALIAPENPYVLGPHLLCAAYEAPLSATDEELFGPSTPQRMEELAQGGRLHHRDGHWYLDPGVVYPAEGVSIRSTSSHYYLVVEHESGRVLERVEEAAAFAQLHPGAVYLHQGEPYLIRELDMEARTAYATPTDVPYYTQARDITDMRILEVHRQRRAGGVRVYLGSVEVSNTVIAYKKKAHFTEEVLGEENLDLPTQPFKTVAVWFDIPEAVVAQARRERLDLAGGLHAAEHAAIGLLPLFALCDRNDIGGVSTPLHPDTGQPQVFIYDGYPGGIGIAERGYEMVQELWEATRRAVQECPCASGCPGCIQSPKCGNNNQPLDKAVALLLLEALSTE